MLNQTTLAQLRSLKLMGLVAALEEQATQPGIQALSFDERLALIVDREMLVRDERRRTILLKKAKLKFTQAAIEDLNAKPGRGFERSALTSLALSQWVTRGDTIVFTGATGTGKSWLACAFAQYACRRGYSALYLRVPRLAGDFKIMHGSGTFGQWLIQAAKTDVLVLDDWGMAAIDARMRSDLLEIIDDRAASKGTIITTQLPSDHWHAWIGDDTIADAILDRVMQRVHKINLTGESMRRNGGKTTDGEPAE